MRINASDLISKLASIYNQGNKIRRGESAGAGRASKADGVELSGRAQEIMQIRELISQTPEVRSDKIEALRQAIENGTYKPDPQAVAGKVLRSKVLDD